jgi:hypothetical protein
MNIEISDKDGEWFRVIKRGRKLKPTEINRVDHIRELWRSASATYYLNNGDVVREKARTKNILYYYKNRDKILAKRKEKKNNGY